MSKTRKLTLVSLVILLTSAFITVAPHAQVEDNPSVATYDENGESCNRFNVGDRVNITAYSDPIYGDYTIEVIDPTPDTRYTHTVTGGGRYSVILSGITDELGWWEVKAGSATTRYASAWYEVIPEVPLGVATALTACFAGLGLGLFRQRRKERP